MAELVHDQVKSSGPTRGDDETSNGAIESRGRLLAELWPVLIGATVVIGAVSGQFYFSIFGLNGFSFLSFTDYAVLSAITLLAFTMALGGVEMASLYFKTSKVKYDRLRATWNELTSPGKARKSAGLFVECALPMAIALYIFPMIVWPWIDDKPAEFKHGLLSLIWSNGLVLVTATFYLLMLAFVNSLVKILLPRPIVKSFPEPRDSLAALWHENKHAIRWAMPFTLPVSVFILLVTTPREVEIVSYQQCSSARQYVVWENTAAVVVLCGTAVGVVRGPENLIIRNVNSKIDP